MWVLELSDISIRLSENGVTRYQQPGVAWAEDNNLTFGAEALDVAKLYPARFHSRYWLSMDQSPVEPKGYAVSTHADLVYQQLLTIKNQASLRDTDRVWLVVPGDWSEAQIGLLYGIALRAGINVADFVDYGAAVGSSASASGKVAVVHFGLQRTVINHVDINQKATRTRVSVNPQLGLIPLMNTWIRLLSSMFLEASRFDPRKFADSEQQIYSQILDFVNSQADDQTITVEFRGNTRTAEVSKSDLVEAAQERYRSTLPYFTEDESVVLGEQAENLPGLGSTIATQGYTVENSNTAQLMASLRPLGELPESDQRVFYTTLDRADLSLEPVQTSVVQPTSALTTHILCESTAYPINNGMNIHGKEGNSKPLFSLKTHQKGISMVPTRAESVSLNGRSLSAETPVQCGDTVLAGDRQFEFIVVQKDGPSQET